MPTLSNGSELTIWENVSDGGHAAFLFNLTDPDGTVSEPIGALPDYFFGWVSLASVDVFDGFFTITGFTNDGKYETFTKLDTYVFDNEGNYIRTLSDEAAYLSADIVSVEASSPDDIKVTWTGANAYFSGENTQYGVHEIILEDGVLLPDSFQNDAPVVSNLNFYLTAGQPLLDVEFSASDADFDLLTYVVVGEPAHGTLELDTQLDGNPYPFYQGDYIDSPHYHGSFLNGNLFDYSPESGFVGTDTFTVYATDGQGNSGLATITINIASPTDGPAYVALSNNADVLRYFNYAHGVMVAAKGGDDDLSGSRFDDSLNGGTGNDLLHGGQGKDKLIGGRGVDRMEGGVGNDTFIFAAGDIADPLQSNGRFDHIVDFHGAGTSGAGEQDFLQFSGFGEDATLVFDHYASTDQLLQVYKVTDPDNPDNSGLIVVQMADGAAQIAQGDYFFL